MNKIFILVLSCMLGLPGLSHGQVSGFLGKRLMLKTDAVLWSLDRDINISAELVVNRGMTLELGYRKFAHSFDNFQNIKVSNLGWGTWHHYTRLYPDLAFLYINETGKIHSHDFTLRGKLFAIGAMQAPYGAYIFASVGVGQGGLSGARIDRVYEEGNGIYANPYRYKIKNLTQILGGTGFGFQYVIKKKVVLDAGFSFDFRYFVMPLEYKLLLPYTISDVASHIDFTESHGWAVKFDGVESVYGLSGFLKLGVFIF
ncbi:MAG: hypothetical protein AB8F95_06320 [Bacteroidia bacterium]